MVTNPGSGYTSAPAIQLRDGLEVNVQGTDASAGVPVLAPNGSPAPLTKQGPGLLSLNSAANSWSGSVTSEAGTLRVNGQFPSSAVLMKSGTELRGTGRCGPVQLTAALLSPGQDGLASAGVLQTASLTTGDSADLDFSLHGAQPGSGYDQLAVTGTVTIGAGTRLHVSPNSGYHPPAGMLFFLLINDGADAINGTFDGVPEGGIVTSPDTLEQFEVTYRANVESSSFTGGNDLAVRYTGQGAPPPVLSIAGVAPSGGQRRVRVSWPLTTGAEWTLQSTATLTTGSWTNSALTVQSDAAGKFVLDTVAPGTPKKFYRLRRP
jgi:autotransporter-associated beta strand protein